MGPKTLLSVAAYAALLGGCGKKGPPLPPIPVLPAAAIDLKVDQRDAAALLTFSAPTRTTTGAPLDGLEAVEIYGFTEPLAPAPEPAAEPTAAALAVAAASGSKVKTAAGSQTADEPALAIGAAAGSKIKTAAGAEAAGPEAGREAIESEERAATAAAPGPAAEKEAPPKARAVEAAEFEARANKVATIEGAALEAATLGGKIQVSIPIADPEAEAPSGWHYYAVRSRDLRGKLSPWSNSVGLLSRGTLPAPAEASATVGEKAIELRWNEVPEALGYRVYRAEGEGPFGVDPLHPALITASAYQDATFEFGRAYRYRIFACREASSPFYEGAPSAAIEVAPRDTFAPAAPSGLSAIARSGGVVELFWEPNREPDLAGYILYRRPAGAGEAAWQAITPAGGQRIESFRDSGLASGASFEYALSAVDDAEPPNESPRSAPIRQPIP